jgi:DNA transformation protein
MSSESIQHLRDLFAPEGALSARAMFGGHGLYLDGLLVGVLIDQALYLKVDALTRPAFEAAGCAPYVYAMTDKPLVMSYWSVPEEAWESAQAMRPWLRLAVEAALRKPPGKPRGARKAK